MAIAAEEAAEQMYCILAERFEPYAPVAQFWATMAEEEATHARILRRIMEGLAPETLAEPVPFDIQAGVLAVANNNFVEEARAIGDLEAAYQLAHEAEHSEINTMFEFLVSTFPKDPRVGDFTRKQLQTHVNKLLTLFPKPYNRAAFREAVLPVDRL